MKLVRPPAARQASDRSSGYNRAFMKTVKARLVAVASCCAFLLLLAACSCGRRQAARDHPRLTPYVAVHDISFHSVALNRDMPYRIVLPVSIPAGQRLPVVYLLHGGGGDYRDWSDYSDVARFAELGLILVMPEGHSSYYTNSVDRPADRYEDYIVTDLIADVESRFPAASGRTSRAIAGVSMGGFGAITLALRHPELFVFAAGMSSAVDAPTRPFSIKRPLQWQHHKSIFGPWGSQARRERDPFVIANSVEPGTAPYLFLSCGEQEGLLPANRKFAELLGQRQFRYEFHTAPGDHNWTQWNERLPGLFQNLSEHIHPTAR